MINPYDPCGENNIVNGKRLTLLWHMYGLNLFHSYEKEVTEVIKKLEEIYSKIRVT